LPRGEGGPNGVRIATRAGIDPSIRAPTRRVKKGPGPALNLSHAPERQLIMYADV
jgi:hypothetical protein